MTRSNRRKIEKLKRKIEKLGGKITGHEYIDPPTHLKTQWKDAKVCAVYWTDADGIEWIQYKQNGEIDYYRDTYTLYPVKSLIRALEAIVTELETKALWK